MRLLATGAWSDAKESLGLLRGLGHEVVFMQQESEPLPCDPSWPEGVICNGLFLHHPISLFTSLRFIQLTSAGADRVDQEYVRAHGITLKTARGVYSIPMAEFAVSGVLALYKQEGFFRKNQAARVWEKRRDLKELYGSAVVIVGCGSVGAECAKRFRAFGCRVLGVDLYPREDAAFDEMLPLDKLDEALPEADILLLCVPLTPETEHLIDGRRLGLLPETAVVVNISRGKVVDEAALGSILASGRIRGAVLDVFETEPLPPISPLWELDNVILTPHNSFVGSGNAARLNELIMSGLPGRE